MGDPLVGVVGELQLEVAVERLTNEFRCRVERHAAAWEACRLIDAADAGRVPPWRTLDVVTDGSGRTLVLATSSFVFERLDRDLPDLR
jgi:peptide subunit release factor RF-3